MIFGSASVKVLAILFIASKVTISGQRFIVATRAKGNRRDGGHRLPFAPLVLTEPEWDEMVRRERQLPREIERDGVDA